MTTCPLTETKHCPDGYHCANCTVCDKHSSKRLARIMIIYATLIIAAIISIIALW